MSQLCVPGAGLGFAYVVPSDHIGFYKALMGKLRPEGENNPPKGIRLTFQAALPPTQ